MPKIKSDLVIEKKNFEWFMRGKNIQGDAVDIAWERIKSNLGSVDGLSSVFESVLEDVQDDE